ncbi:MAG: CRISPR-associated endonuclease Cas2 [Candidatus Poribacteria bacterium]
MYVIIVYDIEQERVAKVCKYLRQSLNWVQNSVFEGELTKAQLAKIKSGLSVLIDEGKDAVIVYTMRDAKWMDREIMGVNKNPATNIL